MIKNERCMINSTWYRPPGSKPQFFNDFETFLKNINENKEIVITGDFNCNMLNNQSNNNANTRTLLDLIDIYQLRQHINMPTTTTVLLGQKR